jgi:hypothetical protein
VRRPAPAGPRPPTGRDLDGLTPWQSAKARRRLDALVPDDRQVIENVLLAGGPEQRGPMRRGLAAGLPAAEVLNLGWLVAGKPATWLTEHLTLVDPAPGAQRRFGVPVDQVDGTTCGSAVLLVLAAQADPRVALDLTEHGGFGARWDDAQRRVHRQSNRLWPKAAGTTPWGMVGWLRRHAPGLGPYRVRLIDDSSGPDLDAALAEVDAALAEGTPVPLLVGGFVPRHWTLALAPEEPDGWAVFEPTSGEVRRVDAATVRAHTIAGVLGYDRLHGLLLPTVR